MNGKIVEAVNLITSWYRDSLPHSFDTDLPLYAIRGEELAKVIEKKAKLNIDPMAPTAYSDKDKIILPASYFMRGFYERVVYLSDLKERQVVAVALALVNGSQIHEVLHIKHDFPGRFDTIIASLDNNELRERAMHSIKDQRFITTLNLVFDLANETWCLKNFAGLHAFLVAKNKVLFNDDVYWRAIEMYRETRNPASVLALLKYDGWFESLSHEDGLEEIVTLAETARNALLAGNHEAEIELSLKIFDLMKSEDESSGEDDGEEGKGDERGEKGKDGKSNDKKNGKGNSSGSTELDPSTFIDSDMSKEDEESIKRFIEENKEETTEKSDKIKGEIRESDSRKEIAKVFEVEYRNIMSMEEREGGKRELRFSGMLKEVNSYRNLGTFFRQMREERHTPGQPRVRGTRIVKRELHRIATDQKVMAYPDSSAVRYGKPEVALLIDSSGSMHSIYSDIVDHAYSVFKEFVNAGIPVSAYAHTSLPSANVYGIVPVVYGIAAFQLPLGRGNAPEVSGNVKARFERTKRIHLAENFDGHAINYVSRLFTSRMGSKVLVVLSDGTPQGGACYGGWSAINHTKQMIEEARKRGVIVLAISLTGYVKPSNDKIYGVDYNLPAYDSNLLNKALSKVMNWVALAHKGE